MEIRGLPAVTRDMRCRERELLPKAMGLRSDKVSIVSDPRILDHMLSIPWSSWPFSGEANGQLSWPQRVLKLGEDGHWSARWPWRSIDATGQDFFQPRAAVIPGRLGTRHVTSQEGLHCSAAGDLEHWFRNLCPAVVFLKERGGAEGREGGREKRRRLGEKKNHKKRKTKITSFVYAERRGIWLTKRGWIIKIIIDMKVHWKLLFFFFQEWNDRNDSFIIIFDRMEILSHLVPQLQTIMT